MILKFTKTVTSGAHYIAQMESAWANWGTQSEATRAAIAGPNRVALGRRIAQRVANGEALAVVADDVAIAVATARRCVDAARLVDPSVTDVRQKGKQR